MDHIVNSFYKIIDIVENVDYGPTPVTQSNFGNGYSIKEYSHDPSSGLSGTEIISGILIDKNTLTDSDTITITFLGNVSGSPLSYYTTTLIGTCLKQGVIYPLMIKKIVSSDSAKLKIKGNVKTIPFGFSIPVI